RFVHPIFHRELYKIIQSRSPDFIHVHDLPLAKTGLMAGKKAGVPVVLDLHENFPDALKVWFKWKPWGLAKLKDQILFSYPRWLKQESWACRRADHIIAVVDEMKSHLIQKHGLDQDKITVITNTELKSFANVNFDFISDLKKQYQDQFVISYIGGMGPHRGLDTVLYGMPEV